MKAFVGTCLLLTLAALAVLGQERYVKPVDDAPKDASFLKFRNRVLKAVTAKDAKYIRSVLYNKIQVDFGGGAGIKDFLETWKNLVPTSDFWAEFGWVASHGGRFGSPGEPKQFWAPYTFSGWPDDLDSFEYAAITGERVRLRSAPNANALVIGYLDFTIVKPKYTNDSNPKWIEVETIGGKRGFVAAEFVRSSVAYRASFSKIGGRWLLTSFISGD